jgi:hypothetical protein
MKKFLATVMMISSVTIFMTSCKKDVLPAPGTNNEAVAPVTDMVQNAPSLQAPRPVTPILTKYGNDSLTYLNDGRLAKVQHGPNSYTQYSYGYTSTTAKNYSGGKLQDEITYEINIQTGRVFESKSTSYINNNGFTIVNSKTYKYEYDADGYLVKMYNKNAPFERADFYWATGDLHWIKFYNSYNTLTSRVQYAMEINDANLDKVKVRAIRTGLDRYLKIFGSLPKHLNYAEELYNGTPNSTALVSDWFTYSFNADGYPTSYTQHEHISDVVLGTFSIKYK